MTEAVKNLTATGYEDGLYRRSRLDRKKAQSLRTDKQAAITFKSDKTNEYKKEVAGLTDKEAAKLGKNALKNEKAAAVVDNRMVHIDARSMEEAKKKHPEFVISKSDFAFFNKSRFSSNKSLSIINSFFYF